MVGMSEVSRGEVTRLLVSAAGGDGAAADALFPIIYEDLRRLAQSYLGRERAGHTLQATALVHEAYLRLVEVDGDSLEGRAHFFRLAARAMRRLLIDHARQRQAQKRGGDVIFQTQSALDGAATWTDPELLDLDAALEELNGLDERKARLVELRFFGGLTIEEAADTLGIGHATAERDWRFSKAWLAKKLGPRA